MSKCEATFETVKFDDAVAIALEAEKRYNRAVSFLMCMKRADPQIQQRGSIASLFGKQRGTIVSTLMRDFRRSSEPDLQRVAAVYQSLRGLRAEDAGLLPNEVSLLDMLYATSDAVKAFSSLRRVLLHAGPDGVDVDRERELYLACARAIVEHPEFEKIEKEAPRYAMASGVARTFGGKRKRQ
jgi:hypothetical protein